jgi:hypothetical protein
LEDQLYTAGDYVVLAYPEALYSISKVTGFREVITSSGSGTIFKKEFRYSFDNETFSEFYELNNENLGSLTWEKGKFTWFQFRYTLMSGGPAKITSITLTYDTYPSDTSSTYVAPNIQNQDKVYAFPVTYKTGAKWNPYKMNRAVRLYKDLNLMVNSLFGHEVHYYRVLPQGRSRDVFLMEYSLYEHQEKQCLKVVVPENQFPDNKLNMGPFGVDFEMPFEIHVDKEYFQEVFGEGTGPQKRDVLYFPTTGRIYEVSSSYLYRDFMYQPLYFKAMLIKWLPKSNVDMTTDPDMMELEALAPSVEKFFGDQQKEEGIDIGNPQQFEQATKLVDPVRQFVDEDLLITDVPLMNYYVKVAEYQYDLSSMVGLTSTDVQKVVTYKATGEFTASQDRAYSAWFKIKKNERFSSSATVSQVDEDNLTATVTYTVPRTLLVGQTISIRRNSGGNFNLIASITEVVSDTQVKVAFSYEMLSYINKTSPSWKTFGDLNVQLTFPRVFIDSRDGNKGVRVELLEKRYFRVLANDKEYLFFLPNTQADLSEDKWYSICVSFSNLFSQLTLNVWEIQWNETTNLPATSDLRQIFGKTVGNIPKEDRSTTVNYYITPSDMLLTNVRVWNQKIETDKQPIVLNQYVVKDASKAIVIDNAIPQSRLPYYSYTH